MATLDDMMTMADELAANEALQPISDLIEQIMALPDDKLDDTGVAVISGAMNGALAQIDINEIAKESMKTFEQGGYTKARLAATVQTLKDEFGGLVESLKPSAQKRVLLDNVFNMLYSIFDKIVEQYHSYDIELPIMLDEGAKMPVYAHESDACADVYALETVTIPAHSQSVTVHTGLHIELPENWQARLAARSGLGGNTPLRVSNAMPIIDTDYRGEILIKLDNISDSDYTIEAGERFIQMWVEPIYRFKAIPTKELSQTERGNGAFGSTGKK